MARSNHKPGFWTPEAITTALRYIQSTGKPLTTRNIAAHSSGLEKAIRREYSCTGDAIRAAFANPEPVLSELEAQRKQAATNAIRRAREVFKANGKRKAKEPEPLPRVELPPLPIAATVHDEVLQRHARARETGRRPVCGWI